MISPASGIHRPSYNGAPAIQTMTDNYWPNSSCFRELGYAQRVRARCPHRSMRMYKAESSRSSRRDLNVFIFRVRMFFMRRMRDFADV